MITSLCNSQRKATCAAVLPYFSPIWVPLEECERRDVKGLYAKARRGEVKQFTGISAPFDVPEHADISIDTTNATPEETAREIFDKISSKIAFEA